MIILNAAMRFVMLRAKAEADAVNANTIWKEHLFLGLLKLAELNAETISPASNHKREIDNDIQSINSILKSKKIETAGARALLRRILIDAVYLYAMRPTHEIPDLMQEAKDKSLNYTSEYVTASCVLNLLLENPTPILRELLDLVARPAYKEASLSDVANVVRLTPEVGFYISSPRDEEPAPEEPEGKAFLAELTERVNKMRYSLLSCVYGQDHAVHSFAEGIFAAEVLAKADAGRRQPRATFVFAGPPGVGKTFLAEQAAATLGMPFRRYDMSGYSDHQQHINLVGFAPSYKDAKEGSLTGFVRKNPHCMLLFDEIEKAHINTIHLFLQVLDSGELHDDFSDKDVLFKDTIIIFTTNAGKQLYDGEHRHNAAGVPRHTIINALETDIHPQTEQPFFPATICSRLATGWPLMFNRLQAHDLERISRHEFERCCALFEKQYGIPAGADGDLLPATLLFAEGGEADARRLKARTELFFKNEIFGLGRLYAEERLENALQGLESLRFKVDTDGLPADAAALFTNPGRPKILAYAGRAAAEALPRCLPGFEIYLAGSREEAFRIAGEQDLDFALLELAPQGAMDPEAQDATGPGAQAAQDATGLAPQAAQGAMDPGAQAATGPAGSGAADASFCALAAACAVPPIRCTGLGPGPVPEATGLGPGAVPDAAGLGHGAPRLPSGPVNLEKGGGFDFDHTPIGADLLMAPRRFFREFRERLPEVPVYLLESGSFAIDDELLSSFMMGGARGKLAMSASDPSLFAEEAHSIARQLYLQATAAGLAAERKILHYETAPSVSADRRSIAIHIRDLSIKRSPYADDMGELLDDAERPDVRFSDVVGAERAKEELAFFVDYLKNPKKFKACGLNPPKGVLLYGPPGTGKTLLARAMAGESDVAFIPVTATSFVTKYQGSGPEAVRGLFRRARRYAPSIVFIDEIDAIGRARIGGESAHGEEMALNALFTEIDGFNSESKRAVFVLAATNFDIEPGKSGKGYIDAALTRRFDRKILVDMPTKDDRLKYMEGVFAKRKGHCVSAGMLEQLAKRSAGTSISTLERMAELGFRNAVAAGRDLDDAMLEEAFEISKHGYKKSWGDEYMERVARHEAGHAYMCFIAGRTPAYLTIVARGSHGGYMEPEADEGEHIHTRSELLGRIRTALGGRAAEIVYYGEDSGVSSSAASDLESATRIARSMICAYGMDDTIGHAVVEYRDALTGPLGAAITARVSEIIRAELGATIAAIGGARREIDLIVDLLLEKNRLDSGEIEDILGQSHSKI
ncbi:MAG: AAA family ATPase [Clostridiales Family XIII bacterium]|jgi:ATP-dependent Zn protease|nr:AAA family ATPase [Clostridiales Family XIII bacterium]